MTRPSTRTFAFLLPLIALLLGGLGALAERPAQPTGGAPAAPAAPAPAPAAAKPASRDKVIPSDPIFESVEVFVDSGTTPLSAYQFELTAPVRDGYEASIVGVEGGEHPAYANPPYYDPDALQHRRIIIAAYSVSPELPTGRTRVARLHMMLRPVARNKEADKKADAGAPTPGKPAAPPAPVVSSPAAPPDREATRSENTAQPRYAGLAPKLDAAAASRYSASIITAADARGTAIPATISVSTGGN